MTENVTEQWLNVVHSLDETTKNQIDNLDRIRSMNDYSSVPPELWHETIENVQTFLELLLREYKRTVEMNCELNDLIEKIVKIPN